MKKDRREQKQIAEIEISNFIRHLKKKNLSGNSIRLQFASVQNFLKYKGVLVTSSFIGNLPTATIKTENRKHE